MSLSSYSPAGGGSGGSILDQLQTRSNSLGLSFGSFADSMWTSPFGTCVLTESFCSDNASTAYGPIFGGGGCPWSQVNVGKPATASAEAAKSNPIDFDHVFGSNYRQSPLLSIGSSAPIASKVNSHVDPPVASSLDSCLKAIWKDAEEELVEARFRTLSLNSEVSFFDSSFNSSFSSSTSSSLSSSFNISTTFLANNSATNIKAEGVLQKDSTYFENVTPTAFKTNFKRNVNGEEKEKTEDVKVFIEKPITSRVAFRGGGPKAEKKSPFVKLVHYHRNRYDSESGRTLVGRDPLNPQSFSSAYVALPSPKQLEGNGGSGNVNVCNDVRRGGGNEGGQKCQLPATPLVSKNIFFGVSHGGNGGGNAGNNVRKSGGNQGVQKRHLPSTPVNKTIYFGSGYGSGGGGGGNRTGGKPNNTPSPRNINCITPTQTRSLNGGGGGSNGYRSRGKKSHQQQRPPTKMECSFCRNISGPDGEKGYKTHWLKDRHNVITCPKLRAYTCPLCLCPGGDNAHTKLYCPMKKKKFAEELKKQVPSYNNGGRVGGGGC